MAAAQELHDRALPCSPACLPPPLQPSAQPADEFYKGKQIRIVVGSTSGGDYDLWARLLARHLPRHIPGHPNFVVENMPGAGTLVATNHLYNVAPKRRHRHRHGVALDAGGRGDEGRQRPLRSGEIQLDRQPRGQSPRALHQQRDADQNARRPVHARADRRRHRARAGHHRRSLHAEEPARHEAQDRHRLQVAGRHGARGLAPRGRRLRQHHRRRRRLRAAAVGGVGPDARAVQFRARAGAGAWACRRCSTSPRPTSRRRC